MDRLPLEWVRVFEAAAWLGATASTGFVRGRFWECRSGFPSSFLVSFLGGEGIRCDGEWTRAVSGLCLAGKEM